MSWSWEQVAEFLDDETRLGRLATADAAGAPHVVPVWFRREGSRLLVHSMGDSRKVHDVEANPRFALAVDKATPPYKGVALHGTARAVGEDEQDWAALVRELAVAYLGEEHGVGYGEMIAGFPGRHVTLVLEPAEWEAWDDSQA